MSRAALPGSRGKEKDRSNARDRSSKWSREPKVDQVFESTDGPTIQGGEFSADEENPEEELYQRIVRERNIARPSKNNDSQVKGKPGERVRERVRRPTEERDENEGRNKPVEKTVSQQPQQHEVFTTAFQLQLVILIVVVVLSLLAHYCLFTHLYRNLRVSVEEGEKKLAVINETFGKLQKNMTKALDEYAEHKDRIKKIKEELDVIQPNTFNKESFMMAFMILTVMVCVLAVAVFNIYQRGSSTEPVHTNGPVSAKRNTKDMGSNDVLRRIPQSPNLQPGVCIISYDDARTGFHRELFDSANIPKCDVKSHVIRRHEQILELPKCKVYLMCTEFSERHVIIEEPGLGLGDLHRTTYYAVKKLGGCLIILYTKDPGSRKLRNQANQALYNTDIYCVKKQQELSDLEQSNGFYSTYDQLSEHQKTVLRQKIVDNMT